MSGIKALCSVDMNNVEAMRAAIDAARAELNRAVGEAWANLDKHETDEDAYLDAATSLFGGVASALHQLGTCSTVCNCAKGTT